MIFTKSKTIPYFVSDKGSLTAKLLYQEIIEKLRPFVGISLSNLNTEIKDRCCSKANFNLTNLQQKFY
jgi:hypothetical protein